MPAIAVRHGAGDRFEIAIGRHTLTVDQPVRAGGTDLGPTPTEVFVASLAGCVAFYANRFLARHGVAAGALGVDCDFAMAADHSRVASIDVRLTLPDGLADELRAPLQRVVEHCTVHSSIMQAPAVTIALPAAPLPARV